MKLTFCATLFLASCFCSGQSEYKKVIVISATDHSSEVSYMQPANMRDEERSISYQKNGKVSFIWWDFIDGTQVDSSYDKTGKLTDIDVMTDSSLLGISFSDDGKIHVRQYLDFSARTNRNGVLIRHQEMQGEQLWFENGELTDVEVYEAGNLVVYSRFSEGQLLTQSVYHDAERNIYREYYSNGQLRMQTPWHRNKLDGIAFSYYDNGKPSLIYEYAEGKLLKARSYDSDGQVIADVETRSNSDVVWQICNPEGTLCCECRMRRGKMKCRPIKDKE